MAGFFSKDETQSKTKPNGKTVSCASCGLYKNCITPKMQPYGNFKKGIMFITDNPTRRDDVKDKLWQGTQGRFFESTLKRLGIDLFEDCITINAVNCYSNEEIIPAQIEHCRRFVLKYINEYKPKLIIPLGKDALFSVIGHLWKNNFGSMNKWRGWTIPDQKFNAWITPIFHPYLIEEMDEKAIDKTIWMQDLERALSFQFKPFPIHKEPEIEIIEDLSIIEDISKYKSKLMVSPYAAFDYETTGIKPHGEDHRIVCASIANNEDHAWAFMMPTKRSERLPFTNFLKNEKICKIAQNMKFEHTWSLVKLRTEVMGWTFDTMLASHLLDNRPEITGLKFQTYVQFGVVDYASDVTPFLQSVNPKNSNSLNKILDLVETKEGRTKLLTYCGKDSVYEYRLAMLQLEEILPKNPRI